MRGTTLGRRIPFSPAKNSPFLSSASSPFSTSSGRGRGRGFGGAGDGSSSSGPRQFDFTARAPGKPDSDDSKPDSSESPPSGPGRGRGKPILPAFSSFVSSVKSAQSGIGRGQVTSESGPGRPCQSQREPVPPSTEFTCSEKPNLSPGESRPESAPPRMQLFRSQQPNLSSEESRPESVRPRMQFTRSEEPNLPSGILSNLTGAGRGKPIKPEAPTPQTMEENRHIRAQPKPKPIPAGPEKVQPKMSTEEAVKKAVSILSRGGDASAELAGPGRGRGRGRGMGKGRGRGRGRDEGGRGRRWQEDSEEGFAEGLYLGDNPDGGEKLAERVGAEVMNKLTEGFEEMGERVLPSPLDDAYLDALHTNYMVRLGFLFCSYVE